MSLPKSKNQWKLLPPSFYEDHTVEVAQRLLGKIIEVRSSGTSRSGRIVETEAYRAGDPASHSSKGKTPRSAIMFGPPGVAYVYFIYGMYEMLNFVTEPEGQPGAVLIRSIAPIQGIDPALQTNGPGKLTLALGISRLDNGANLGGPRLFVWDDGYRPPIISSSSRVGIKVGLDRMWRFMISNRKSTA